MILPNPANPNQCRLPWRKAALALGAHPCRIHDATSRRHGLLAVFARRASRPAIVGLSLLWLIAGCAAPVPKPSPRKSTTTRQRVSPLQQKGTSIEAPFPVNQDQLWEAGMAVLQQNGFTLHIADAAAGRIITHAQGLFLDDRYRLDLAESQPSLPQGAMPVTLVILALRIKNKALHIESRMESGYLLRGKPTGLGIACHSTQKYEGELLNQIRARLNFEPRPPAPRPEQ